MKKPISLADTLFTQTQQRILTHLVGSTDRSCYLNELVRLAGIGKGTVKRELDRMVACGLLTATRQGNRVHFRANEDCPILAELKGIVKKTFGVALVIQSALEPLTDTIAFAFIHGSQVKANAKVPERISLLVIGNSLTYARVMELLKPAEQILERPFDLLIYSLTDFNRKMAAGNGFLRRVMERDKIPVLGSEQALAAPAKPPKKKKH